MNSEITIYVDIYGNYNNVLKYFDKDIYTEKEYTYLKYYCKSSLFKLAIIKNKKNIIKNLYNLIRVKSIDYLIEAIKVNNTELSKLLLNTDIDPFIEGQEILLLLIRNRNIELIKLLLQKSNFTFELLYYSMKKSLEYGYYDIFELFKKHENIIIKNNKENTQK